jgi:hypothetical protein
MGSGARQSKIMKFVRKTAKWIKKRSCLAGLSSETELISELMSRYINVSIYMS